ncbi:MULTISPECIES: hypothetical protein [unclassified Xanthobacter]|nr:MULTISPECIES: hypothetical protein [unclassified Xanthobacter]
MRNLVRLMVVAGFAMSLSACDKCGNWFGQSRPGACQTQTPR